MSDPFFLDSPIPLPPPTSYERWQKFVNQPPVTKPTVPTPAEFARMTDQERANNKRQRVIYHASFEPIGSPKIDGIIATSIRIARDNIHAKPGNRPGITYDGAATAGKTTAVQIVGRKYEALLRQQCSMDIMPSGHMFIPVVYVSLPADTTIKSLNWAITEFYGFPAPRSASADFLTRHIMRHADLCGTSMIIVDDIHYLKIRSNSKMGSQGAETVNNHLKMLANSISATFIYAGINCENTGLLNEGLSEKNAVFSQTGKRFKLFKITPFSMSTPAEEAEWRSLLATFETHLCLVNHAEGALNKYADYILSRTSGYMGPVSNLIREAANLAIRDGDEKITRKLLSKVTLDYESEMRFNRLNTVRKLAPRPSKKQE